MMQAVAAAAVSFLHTIRDNVHLSSWFTWVGQSFSWTLFQACLIWNHAGKSL